MVSYYNIHTYKQLNNKGKQKKYLTTRNGGKKLILQIICGASTTADTRPAAAAAGARGYLEYGDVVVDFGAMLLGDALGDPDNVAALLLLELEVRIEDTEMELLQEGKHVQLHLVLEELVLECLVPRIVAGSIEECCVLSVILGDSLHLLVVIGTCQGGQSVGVHLAAVGVQLGTIVLGQLGAERVDRYDDGATIGLELNKKSIRR